MNRLRRLRKLALLGAGITSACGGQGGGEGGAEPVGARPEVATPEVGAASDAGASRSEDAASREEGWCGPDPWGFSCEHTQAGRAICHLNPWRSVGGPLPPPELAA